MIKMIGNSTEIVVTTSGGKNYVRLWLPQKNSKVVIRDIEATKAELTQLKDLGYNLLKVTVSSSTTGSTVITEGFGAGTSVSVGQWQYKDYYISIDDFINNYESIEDETYGFNVVLGASYGYVFLSNWTAVKG